jgi:hypothetical protein
MFKRTKMLRRVHLLMFKRFRRSPGFFDVVTYTGLTMIKSGISAGR